jgi:hypothetical protein
MKRELGKEYTDKELRIRFLKDNCDKVEEKTYSKRFTPDELMQMKEELSETAIKINDIEEAKKEAVAGFKKELDPLVDEKKRLLEGLKTKSQLVRENTFKFIDLDSKEVGYYNEDGELIESRPAYGDELQSNIFQLRSTGTEL